MANFRTHITVSTAAGAAYGAAGYALGVPWESCLLAAGLCSAGGVLPDLDSDNSVPLRETVSFTAAVAPMLLLDRWRHMGVSTDLIVLLGGVLYLAIRFVFFPLLRWYTVHRGMFHSIPAAIICGQLVWLMTDDPEPKGRLYKAVAATLGYLVHLGLDELYSFQRRGVLIRRKRSAGTALKWWGPNLWANITTYGKLALLSTIIAQGPSWQQAHSPAARRSPTPEPPARQSAADSAPADSRPTPPLERLWNALKPDADSPRR